MVEGGELRSLGSVVRVVGRVERWSRASVRTVMV